MLLIWKKPITHQMIRGHYREGILGRPGWEGRPLWLIVIQIEKMGRKKWKSRVEVVLKIPRIFFSEQHFIFALLGAERAGLFSFFFLQHLACHLIYVLEIANSTEREKTQDLGER